MKVVAPFLAGSYLAVYLMLGGRVGPGRASVLAFKSYFQRSINPSSVRPSVVARIRKKISQVGPDEFVVVHGPEGVGKTVAVATAVRGQMGVIHVNIYGGDSSDEIVQKALRSVANVSGTFPSVDYDCPRIIFWYQLMFRHYPLIILNLRQRSPKIEEAARILSYTYKLRVLVDSSDNALPDELFLWTQRARFVDVNEMDQATVEGIPEFTVLITSLREADLADVVYHIIGGVPYDYEWLRRTTAGLSGEKLGEAVNLFLRRLQFMAINLKLATLRSHPDMLKLYDPLKTMQAVSDIDYQVTRPSPDKTLRKGRYRSMLVPATQAMAYILRNNCEAHSVAQIREVMKCQRDIKH